MNRLVLPSKFLIKLFTLITICLFLISKSYGQSDTTISTGDGPQAFLYVNNKLYCAHAYSNDIRVFDGATNDSLATVSNVAEFDPKALVYNSTNDKVYCAYHWQSDKVYVIDASSDTLITRIATSNGPIALAYNSTNNKVYSANYLSDTVAVIDGASDTVITMISVGDGPRDLLYNPNNNKIYCANSGDHFVTVIDGSTDTTTTISVSGGPRDIVSDPNYNRIYTANYWANTVAVIDPTDNSLVTTINVGTNPYALAYNSTSNKVYCANKESNDISIIDATNNTVIATIPTGSSPEALIWSSFTNYVYCANSDSNTVTVIDGSADTVVTVIDVGIEPVAFAENPTQHKIYVANRGSDNITVLSDEVRIPVELTSFTASAIENTVKLQWSTATETNNSGFEIQRSKKTVDKDEEQWENIGFVKGKGTTTEPQNYNYEDKEIIESGKYLYRLKQIDFDGTYEYSKTVEVVIGTPYKFELEQNYPNPFNPTTTIKFTLPSKELTKLTVYNVLGEEVAMLINEELQAGYHKVSFNAGGLPSGVYFYRIKAGNFTQVRKMILAK